MTGVEILTLGLIFTLAGISAGLIAGLLGVGGGVVIVPVMFQTFIFLDIDPSLQMHCAIATSLAVIVVTALQSGRTHYKANAVDMSVIRDWAPAVVMGVIAGAVLARFADAGFLKAVFGVLSLLIAIHMVFSGKQERHEAVLPSQAVQKTVAAIIGFFSALMGIGGGTFTVVALQYFGRSIHQAVGTSAAMGFFIAFPGAIGYAIAGWGIEGLPPYSAGYVNLLALAFLLPLTSISAPWGAKLAHRFERRTLEYLFIGFLLLSAARMFWSLFG